MLKKILYPVAAVIVILIGYLALPPLFSAAPEIPTVPVEKGDFSISVRTTGSVDAKQAYTITTPRIRGLQITWLAPEGSIVEEGDTIVKFDSSEQLAELEEYKLKLKIANKSLERQRQEYVIQEKQLRLDLQKAERNYNEKRHEAPKLAEEAKLELELARLNSEVKLEQIKADIEKAELEVQQAREKVNQSQRELNQMTLTAPIPGMVVYLEIWKGGTRGKVQEGDSPWPGQGLINLPNLNDMIVETTVSEVDAAQVDSGQTAVVTLDAFPDDKFDGMVYNKSTLARRKERGSQIKVFDIKINILEKDERIKPGMSASCDIIAERFSDVVHVPLEAVFEKDGKPVVYLENKEKRVVEVGRRNDKDIEIVSGLEGGERICLLDPTLEEYGLPGEKATEPEMNKPGVSQRGNKGGRKRANGL
ncbi:MAG: efflux RND transporter periplasmic adaptor subunit [candidate division Zixibacteria bacterium]|nr:efflux RND transporter periplasmic adaptor subunit [candidate division Zixibacteria bacterium]